MKQFFLLTILFGFAGSATIAQTAPVANDIKATIVNNDLILNWTENSADKTAAWEVQGSVDGKSFQTIGLVWGADPKAGDNNFAFKQKKDKTQATYKYFRVLYVAGAETALASNTVRLSK